MTLFTNVHSLPFGVIDNVLAFVPPWNTKAVGLGRHITAQLLLDANKNDQLSLVYLRKKFVQECLRKNEIYNSLAPSVTGSSVYGDDEAPMKIRRTKITVGEKIRMKAKYHKNTDKV